MTRSFSSVSGPPSLTNTLHAGHNHKCNYGRTSMQLMAPFNHTACVQCPMRHIGGVLDLQRPVQSRPLKCNCLSSGLSPSPSLFATRRIDLTSSTFPPVPRPPHPPRKHIFQSHRGPGLDGTSPVPVVHLSLGHHCLTFSPWTCPRPTAVLVI
mmetsp:Transcript_78052/g.137732  ORF Transcript_78052/g.137732 Transcript_78052/m.137732 type:complete len:153 (-) Transcript_78052:174-632(-)